MSQFMQINGGGNSLKNLSSLPSAINTISSGLKPRIVVTTNGTSVYATKSGVRVDGVLQSDGTFHLDIDIGTWTVYSTLETQTKSASVNVATIASYKISITVEKMFTLTITGLGSMSSGEMNYGSYVKVNNTTYTSRRTLSLVENTSVSIYGNGASTSDPEATYGNVYVLLDGKTVGNHISGHASSYKSLYTFKMTKSYEVYLVSGTCSVGQTGQKNYYVDITSN